jgi:trans-aconitate 2-methyltransferase
VASQPKWSKATEDVEDLFTIHQETFYYDQLSKYFSTIEIWTTYYYHIMESQEAILEMIRSTGLKPYLDRIPEQDVKEFESLILTRLMEDYPTQENGKVLFPFKRLFFIAQ